MGNEQQHTDLDAFLKREKHFLEDLQRVDMKKNWERLEKATKKKGGRTAVLAWSLVAALALILLVVGSTMFLNRTAAVVNQVAANEQRTEVLLDDGTVVSLNHGAAINYTERLIGRKREVTLSGEAYFEVEPRRHAPFYVIMDQLTVKVTGTSFHIKATETSTTVSVISGEVHLFQKGKEKEALVLHSGQNAVYSAADQTIGTGEIHSENFLFWKTGRLEFRNDSLATVCSELGKWFGTAIVLSDKVNPDLRWTSLHENESLEDILNEVTFYFDLEYSETRDTIYIQPIK
jgi:transmembrane sensor